MLFRSIVTLVIVAMGADKEKKVIRPKVEDFFSSFDRKDYGHLYEALFCESFKANTGRVKFLKRFAQASDNLGTLRKRNDGLWKTGTAAGVPVYTIEYRSEYAKGTVEEVLSFTKENGTWCVSDYGGTKPGSATGA